MMSTSDDCPIHGNEGAERLTGRLPGPTRRPVLFAVGMLSVVLGVIGIVVPLWPTTCFLLLAAWCFARSSERMYRWLHENALFGEYLREYRDHRVISPRVRTASVLVLWGFIATSLALVDAPPWLWALLLFIGVAVTTHLYTLRPRTVPDAPSHVGS